MKDDLRIKMSLDSSFHLSANDDKFEWTVYMEPNDLYLSNIFGRMFVYNEDTDEETLVGNLAGILVDCKHIEENGESLHNICDAHSGDMEYIASSLCDGDELKPEYGGDNSKFLYLDRLYIEPEYRNCGLGARVLEELPQLIYYSAHMIIDFTVLFAQAVEKIDDQYKRVDEGEDLHNRLRKVDEANPNMKTTLRLLEFLKRNDYVPVPDSELYICSYNNIR